MIRPFRLLPSRDLETLCARTLESAAAWARHWLPDIAGLTVSATRASRASDAWTDALIGRAGDKDWCALKVEPGDWRRIGSALLGDSTLEDEGVDSDLVEDLCQRALGAIVARCAGLADPDDCSNIARGGIAAAELAPGAGSVVVELEVDGTTLRLMLAAGITEAWLGARPAAAAPVATLSPPRSALGGQRLRAVCELTDTELELGALASLAVGDVITLDHPLDRPLRLRFEGADVPCEGYLCQRETRDAIMLVRTNSG